MNAVAIRRILSILGVVVLALPALAAGADPGHESRPNVVVVGEDGDRVTVRLENGELTIVSDEDGETSTTVVGMEAVGLMAAGLVDEAMVGLEDVLGELGRMQFQYRAGQDNRVNLAFDDTELEIDLDAIMAEVATAVQAGLAEIDTSDWTATRGRWDQADDDALREELQNLKAEMKELRRELRRLQDEESGR